MGKVKAVFVAGFGIVCVIADDGRLLAAEPAKDYPNKPVRMIVPFAAGGGVDFMARVIGARLTESLGQPFVVDTRTGAGSTIGTALAAKAAPDGHTLLVSSISLTFNASLYKDLPYDTVRDLAPLSMISTSPNIMSVHPSVPAKSVQELILLARSRPGKLNYGSGGVGGSDHVSTEYFANLAGIKIVNVIYKGSGPAMIDLAAGSIDLAITPLASAMPIVKSGKVRVLGVTSAKRTPLMPEVPTIAESGLPRYEYASWYGMWAPAGTPQPIVARLNDEVRKALQLPDVRERIASQGAEPAWSAVEDYTAFVKAEITKWAPIIKTFGPPQ
jgi:tripartite-type tricarboxylate transporter receptor subunit TctC